MFVIRAERNENRGPSIDDSYQASVHLAKQFLRRFFEIDNQQQELPMGSHVCKWIIGQSETRIAFGGHVC